MIFRFIKKNHCVLCLLFLCFISVFMLSGCSNENTLAEGSGDSVEILTEAETSTASDDSINEQSGDVKVMDYRTDWSIEERKVGELPEDYYYLGSTDNGFFYRISADSNIRQDDGPTEYGFYFRMWSGEDLLLYEVSTTLYSWFNHKEYLFLSVFSDDGVEIVELNEEGNAKIILTAGQYVLPRIYGYEDELIIVAWDKNEEGEEVYRIFDVNINIGEPELIYESRQWIRYACKSESGIIFSEGDENEQQMLYLYDTETDSIVKSAELERPIVFVAENNGMLYLSGRGTLATEELGEIYEWNETSLEKKGMIPFVAENNLIMSGSQIGNYFIWNAQKNGYVLDLGKETLWMFDFRENEESKLISKMEDDGFSGIVQRNGENYYVKYSIPGE
ncbi:MAG: hypothetical protein LUG83_04375 [Lachnospiraceae bacterium]|nr:hypothetical protein [Lachnospiraceae bacterium]